MSIYMKQAFLTLFFLLAPRFTLAVAPCHEVIPFERIGPLIIGQQAPLKVGGSLAVRDKVGGDVGWKTAGAWRFRIDAANRIDYIQYELEKAPGCVKIKDKKFSREISYEKLKKLLPGCLHEQGMPSPVATCEGYQMMFSRLKTSTGFNGDIVLRVDVNVQQIADLHAGRAKTAVEQEWKKHKYPKFRP